MFVYILFFLIHFLCALSFGAFMSSARTAEFVLSLDGVPALHSGFHTSSTEGAFTSINGKPAIILYHDGLVALERCEAFHANGTSGTVNCDYLLPYVCFVPASAPEPAPVTVSTTSQTPIPTTCPSCPTCPIPVPTTCPTPAPTTCPTPVPTTCPTLLPSVESCEDLRYELNETTGHWYKYHTEGKSWNDANRTCVEEGAHLAIINSLAEKNVLVDLHNKFKLKIHDAKSTGWVSIGVHKDYAGVWRTVDGQTLKEAGYEEWYPMHPLDWTREGQMSKNGSLLSFNHHNLAFICEKE